MQARQLEHLAQILDDGEQPAVAGEFLDLLVEFLICLEEGIDTSIARGGFQAFVNFLECVDIDRLGVSHRFGGATAFQHGHQWEDVVQVLTRNLCDVTTPARPEFNEALGGEHLEGFAQRCPRNTVLLCKFLFVNPGARGQFMGKYALAQSLGNFLIKGGGCNTVHGLGVVSAGKVSALLTCFHNYGYSIMWGLVCQAGPKSVEF